MQSRLLKIKVKLNSFLARIKALGKVEPQTAVNLWFQVCIGSIL
jgi:hypothetical protein